MGECTCCLRRGVLPCNCNCSRPGVCRRCLHCDRHCACRPAAAPGKAKARKFHRLPKAGDKVAVLPRGARPEYPAGTVGTVVDILDGCCGPIVAVRFPNYPGTTADLFWKKVEPVGRG